MWKSERLLNISLLLFTVVAIFGMFSASNEPIISILRGSYIEPYLYALHDENSIIFNLSIGYLISVFFWLLVVYIPEQSRRQLLRDNLSRRYQDFKEATIQSLLWAAIGTHDSMLPEELCDHQRFRDFFNQNNKQHWYAALNGLQENPIRIEELLLELEVLSGEVSYVLNNVSIQDPQVHSFFKRLNEHIYRLKRDSVYSDDQVKYLGGFFWEIHAGWSFIDGYREDDIIRDMISAI